LRAATRSTKKAGRRKDAANLPRVVTGSLGKGNLEKNAANAADFRAAKVFGAADFPPAPYLQESICKKH